MRLKFIKKGARKNNMKDLQNALRCSNKLLQMVEEEKFLESDITFIQNLTKKIKKFMRNFERDYDFLNQNITLENLSGGCTKELMLIIKEVKVFFKKIFR